MFDVFVLCCVCIVCVVLCCVCIVCIVCLYCLFVYVCVVCLFVLFVCVVCLCCLCCVVCVVLFVFVLVDFLRLTFLSSKLLRTKQVENGISPRNFLHSEKVHSFSSSAVLSISSISTFQSFLNLLKQHSVFITIRYSIFQYMSILEFENSSNFPVSDNSCPVHSFLHQQLEKTKNIITTTKTTQTAQNKTNCSKHKTQHKLLKTTQS